MQKEDAATGAQLGAPFAATDVDAGQTLTYAITSGAFDGEGGALFRIDPSTGAVSSLTTRSAERDNA